MATNGKKWWRQPWVWIVVVPVVIVGALTASHQPTTTADPAVSITVTDTTTPPAVTTTTTVPVPTTTVPPPPPAPAPTDSTDLCGAPPNPLGYNYCGRGQRIDTPSPDTCAYFQCIPNWVNGKGYMEECQDGDVSMSGGRRGSCSYHGGNERAVYQS